MTEPAEHGALANRRVLVVEDEYFIADDITRALQALGAHVVGPAPDRERALDLLEKGRVDLAVLDINLSGEMVYPIADLLVGRGVPVVFATGYDRAALPARFADAPRWDKPFDPGALARALPALVPPVSPVEGTAGRQSEGETHESSTGGRAAP